MEDICKTEGSTGTILYSWSLDSFRERTGMMSNEFCHNYHTNEVV